MDFSDHAEEQEQLLSLKKVYMILKQLQNQLHLKETNKLKERDWWFQKLFIIAGLAAIH